MGERRKLKMHASGSGRTDCSDHKIHGRYTTPGVLSFTFFLLLIRLGVRGQGIGDIRVTSLELALEQWAETFFHRIRALGI
jgi:hypothetical protein